MFADQCFQFQPDELIQAHFQYGVCLLFRKPELRRHDLGFFGAELDACNLSLHQAGFRHSPVPGAAEDFNDQVNYIAGFNQPFLDFLPFPFFGKEGGIFSGGYLELKIYVMLNNFLKPHYLRPAFRDGQHVHAKGILQTGLFVEHVNKVVHIRVFFQLNHDPDAFLGGLVGNVHNIHGLFALGKSRHVHEEFGNVRPNHGIRDLADHHIGFPSFPLFNVHLTPDFDFSRAGFIDI
ncbi:hypothetical protein IMSAGC019_01904 [Lachnospiraceae bacterium]|nr:hypothetical protein IMSAGC019_01904 [Lachnospiraceae bacterium]